MEPHIKEWLNARGISDAVLLSHEIASTAAGKIIIPVRDASGVRLFHKYRRAPNQCEGPKYTYDQGATSTLFNIEKLADAEEVIICEGEFDCLALESKGLVAVTSTGGAGTFREEWGKLFEGKRVYVCFDNDRAGQLGTIKVCRIIPYARVIPLPAEVGDHGDITDYFVKLGKNADDFRILMAVSEPLDLPPEPKRVRPSRGSLPEGSDLLKAKSVPIDTLIEFNGAGFARCPAGEDRTPSLKRYEGNRWHCFKCGRGGDTIDLMMKMHPELSMREAIKRIIG